MPFGLDKFKKKNKKPPKTASTPKQANNATGADSAAKSIDNKPNHFERLEAFKTITMLLEFCERNEKIIMHDNLRDESASVQESNPSLVKHAPIKDVADRYRIRVMDAFAQLGVQAHEIGAVVAEETNEGEWNLLASTNWRRTSNEPAVITPQIHKPSCPKESEGMSGLEYMEALNTRWKRPSISEHLWILSDALSGSIKGGDDYQTRLTSGLTRYACVNSILRIGRRLRNDTECEVALRKIEAEDIPAIPEARPTETSSNFSEDKGTTRRLRSELDSDRRFLLDFILLYAEPSKYDDGQLIDLKTKFPNLIKMAMDADRTRESKAFCIIYTNQTRREFHSLLLELLEQYAEAVEALTRKGLKEEQANSTDKGAKEFNSNVRKVDFVGYGLLRIARGHAFQMHLENIGKLLGNGPRKTQASEKQGLDGTEGGKQGEASSASLPGRKKDIDAEESNNAGVDIGRGWDIDAGEEKTPAHVLPPSAEPLSGDETFPRSGTIKPAQDAGHSKPLKIPTQTSGPDLTTTDSDKADMINLLQSYRNWLLVLVGHLDAVEILMDHLASEHRPFDFESISLSILVIPETPNTFLGLQDLFKQDRHIIQPKGESLDHQGILQFLNDGLKDAESNTKITLPPKQAFFRNLKSSLAKKFKGTCHCEANLATLLPFCTELLKPDDLLQYEGINILPDMKGFGRLIGVSKRSCPPCAVFLYILRPNDGFITRGNHNKITACSLPPWTPDRIIAQMNQTFGEILWTALVAIFLYQFGQ
ncbi:hypothetical protein BDN70DRAFT_939831 [Pholiota conissans]|uniref:Uncharacterized protein n=1 Tax=Pholiota conissans TaxID=109636 RepID=A0A9P6CL60_9AGAR|nr:hypothetical protein BDN70DRAFT_939831 [Pholiota conissans]